MKPKWQREIESAATAWREEASRRRELTKHDPVADVLDYAAADLLERLRPLVAPDAVVTAADYARQVGVRPQTVLGWIRRGLLHAHPGPHGWEIAATAKPPAPRIRRVA